MSEDYAYHKKWKYDASHGQYRTTLAGPVHDHVVALLAAGWTIHGIADAAGLGASTIHNIASGAHARTSRIIARKTLAVTGDTIRARPNRDGFILKTGAVRRIQALLAIGHRHADITAAMNSYGSRTHSQLVLHQPGRLITRATHDAITAVYNQLSMTPGPSPNTAARAVKLGYLPPLAWDDHDLDNPDRVAATVTIDSGSLDDVAVEQIMTGALVAGSSPARLEAIRRLAAKHLTDNQIAERIHMRRDAVTQARTRHGIPAGKACSRERVA